MEKKEKGIAFLGKDTEFEGTLRFEGSLRIEGSLQGEIISKGTLTIGEHALVKANIRASYIVISGEFHGDIIADQRVDFRAPAKVFGNILAPAVVMDAGVIFEGHTRMYRVRGAAEEVDTPLVEADAYKGGPPEGLTAVYGIVMDAATGKPVKKVKIECRGRERQQTETNSSGYYEIINLNAGEWTITAATNGYRKEKIKIEIPGEGTYRQNFTLAPKTGSPFSRIRSQEKQRWTV